MLAFYNTTIINENNNKINFFDKNTFHIKVAIYQTSKASPNFHMSGFDLCLNSASVIIFWSFGTVFKCAISNELTVTV